jgi:hypothetical protein
MTHSECKILLESLRTILSEGPDDRFRVRLREAIDSVLRGEMSARDLPDYLRPVLRRLAVSYQAAGRKAQLDAALALMRL